MTTLTKAIRRRVMIRGREYAVTIDAVGLTFRPFGKRTGVLELPWNFAELRAAQLVADRVAHERRAKRRGVA